MRKNLFLLFFVIISIAFSTQSNAQCPGIAGTLRICQGSTSQLGDAADSLGAGAGTWTSGSLSIATVGSSTGIVTGVNPGTSVITYHEACGTATVVVTVAAVPGTITGTGSACAGSLDTMHETITGGTWSSSNTLVASIGSTGAVRTFAPGTDTIRYTNTEGCAAIFILTVHGPVAITPHNPTICTGSTLTLSDAVTGGSWFSATTSVATIGSTSGTVSGASAGVSVISYVFSSCVARDTVTVVDGAGTISPTTAISVCAGSSFDLNDATSGGIWSSRNTYIATVNALGTVFTASPGIDTIVYTVSGCTASKRIQVNGPKIILPHNPTICIANTVALTDSVVGGGWSSGGTSIATVGSTGVVTGVSTGSATITYTVSSCSAYDTVTVVGSAGVITPATPVTICVGSSTPFSDTAVGGAWNSTAPGVATVAGFGLIVGLAPGTATITYTVGSCTASKVVTVTAAPTVITGRLTVCAGSLDTLRDATSGGTWSSSITSVASINAFTGIFTGGSPGTTVITYSLGASCSVTTTVTVIAATPAITGTAITCAGQSTILTDASSGGTWSSGNTAVATVTIIGGTTAAVFGVSGGTAIITYSTGTCFATKIVTVVASSPISPLTSSVCVGGTETLTEAASGGVWSTSSAVATVAGGLVTGLAIGTDTISYQIFLGGAPVCAPYAATVNVTPGAGSITPAGSVSVCAGQTTTLIDGTTGGTWQSGNTAKATVSSTGVVTGVSAGTVTITYTVGSCNTTKVITVVAGAGTISPASASICTFTSTTFSDATTGGIWGTTTPAIISITAGNAVGIATGVGTVTYTVGTCSSSVPVTVNASPVAITPSTAVTLCMGSTTILADATSGGSWSSSSTSIATVNSTGTVTGVSAGSVTISYTIGTCFAVKAITILSGPASITPLTPTVCTGTTTSLIEGTTGGTWSSSTPAAATVSSSGVVYGVAAGTTTISYLAGTCSATTVVTVVGAPAAITPSSTVSFCVGTTTTLEETSTGGSWSSSATSVATVSSTGIVSGVTTGTAVISYTVGSCYATKIITVSPGPAALLPASPTICTGTTLTLTDAVSGGTWSSSSLSIATVGSTGIVSGVSAGTVNIYYIIGSCVATAPVTVSLAPSPGTISGTTSVCLGSTISLTDGTSGGTWSSSSTTIASVSTTGTVSGIGVGTATISYSVGSSCGLISATHIVTVNTTPTAGTIVGPSGICSGTTTTLTDAVIGGTWSSSNSSATVNITTGLLTGVTPGIDTITYKVITPCGNATTTKIITVGSFLSAGTITGATTLCGGTTVTLTDAFTGGTWSSSNSSASVSSTGVVTGAPAGGTDTITYSVTAACGIATASHVLTVNPAPVAGSVTGVSSICIGTTSTLADATTGGVWSSSNSSVATVSGGVVTPVSVGTATISYTVSNSCGTLAATEDVTVSTSVTAGTISGPANVCPGSPVTLTDGVSGGVWSSSSSNASVSSSGVVSGVSAGAATISYTVTGSCGTAVATYPITVSGTTLSAGTIVGVSSLCVGSFSIFTDVASGGVWTSSNGHASVVSTGVVTGMSVGVDTIYYTVTNSCGTAVASQVVTISGTLTAGAISGAGNVCIGFPVALTETVSGGVWSSSNANASVSGSGLVTGFFAGLDTIAYTVTTGCGTATATFVISVNSTAPSAGTITGPSGVCAGYPVLYTNPIAGGVWSMSNGRASISTVGLVSGITGGTDTIRYTVSTPCGTATTTKVITIGFGASVSAIAGSSVVCVSSSATLTDATSGGSWSSSNANTAVSGTGIVTGVTVGTSIISYSVGFSCGVAIATKTMTVNPSAGISPITGTDSVCQGASITLTDATSGGIWTSGSPNATVSGGVLTGVTAGTAPISYSVSSSCGTLTSVAVVNILANPAMGGIGPISSLSIVCVGSGITLTDPTPGGTWMASNGHAAVVGAGIIDGVSPGVDTISYVITNGCGTGAAIKILSVDTIPIVAPIVGPSSQCVGTSITLTDPTSGGVWTTSTPSVGTVTVSSGVVTGLSAGTTTITYTVTNLFGCPGSVTITDAVTPPSITTGITGITSVCAGSSVGLSNATAGGSWSSSDPSIASIDPSTGIVVGVSTGSVTISYTITNSCGTSTVTSTEVVNSLPSVAAISGSPTGCVGSSVTLSDATPGGGWTSADASIATVNATTGEVTGTSAGTVNINYTVTSIFGCSLTVNTPILINPAPSVAPISGTAAECAGSATSLSDVTTGGVWSSSNPLIATVDASGTVSGIVPGSATISYSIAGVLGCTGSASVINIVNAIPVESPVTGVLRVCAGASSALSNSIPGGTWSSANASVAIVNATTGVVTGVSGGTDEIYYSVSNSCGSALDSASVTVLPSPTVAAITAAYTSLCTGNRIDLTESTTGGAWGSTNASIATVTTAGVVTGVTAGVDTIYYSVTNSSGCSATAIVRILVGGAMPSASVTPNSTVALCEGHTTTMHASSLAGISYQWMRNGTAIAGATDSSYTTSATGNYTVIISNGICSETLTGPSVVAPARPVVSFNPPDMLYTGTYATYQWFKNGVLIPGANGNIIHETGGGVYTVVVTLAGGCSDTSVGYTVSGLGVTIVNGAQDIKVYPNPATSIVHIDAPEKINVSVLSVDGKLLMERKDATDIDISSLANGMYIIRIYDENKLLLKTAKFAKVE